MKKYFENKESYGSILLMILLDHFGPEVLTWSPTTIRMEIEETWGVELSDLLFDKIMAAILIVQSDFFYRRLSHFVQICNALSGSGISQDFGDPANPEEMGWAITEAYLLFPPDEADPFSEDIVAYMANILDAVGIKNPPSVLQIAVTPEDFEDVSSIASVDPVAMEIQAEKTEELKEDLAERFREWQAQFINLPFVDHLKDENGKVDLALLMSS